MSESCHSSMHARQGMIQRFSLTMRPLQVGDAGEDYGLAETDSVGPSNFRVARDPPSIEGQQAPIS